MSPVRPSGGESLQEMIDRYNRELMRMGSTSGVGDKETHPKPAVRPRPESSGTHNAHSRPRPEPDEPMYAPDGRMPRPEPDEPLDRPGDNPGSQWGNDLQQGLRDIEQGRKDREQGLRDIEQAQRDREQGLRDIEQAQRDREQGLRDIEQGKMDKRQGMVDIERGLRELREGLRELEQMRRSLSKNEEGWQWKQRAVTAATFPEDEYAQRQAAVQEVVPGRVTAQSSGGGSNEGQGVGKLVVQVYTARRAEPVAGAQVVVTKPGNEGELLVRVMMTDEDGKTAPLSLPVMGSAGGAPEYSSPYADYRVYVNARGFGSVGPLEAQIFPGITGLLPVELIPSAEGRY